MGKLQSEFDICELQFLEDESTRIHNCSGLTFFQKIGMIREIECDIALSELESEIGEGGHTHNLFDSRYAFQTGGVDGEILINDNIIPYEVKNHKYTKFQSPYWINREHTKRFEQYQEPLFCLNIVSYATDSLRKLGHEIIEVGFQSFRISRKAIDTIKEQFKELLTKYQLISSIPMSRESLDSDMINTTYSNKYNNQYNKLDIQQDIPPTKYRNSLVDWVLSLVKS